jgi:Na+-transporting methylmalonyl-CoA/oxaloacetate decarboxylase gamma subunit
MPVTTVLALSDTHRHLWWGAVIGGFVVVLAVAALLTILVLLVRTIDQRVVQIRDSLQQAAENTENAALIAETATRVEAVLAEGLEHHLFLGRVLGKVRS